MHIPANSYVHELTMNCYSFQSLQSYRINGRHVLLSTQQYQTPFRFSSSRGVLQCKILKSKCKVTCKVAHNDMKEAKFTNKAVAKLLAVVGHESLSPIQNTPWLEVMNHTSERLKWVDEGYEMLVFTDKDLCFSSAEDRKRTNALISETDIVIAVSLQNDNTAKALKENTQKTPTLVCFNCSSILQNKVSGLLLSENYSNIIDKLLVPKKKKESLETLKTVNDAWNRYNTDDILFSLLILINSCVKPVPVLKNLRATGLSTLYCMVKNCGPQIISCLLDPNCRKALACLNNCAPTDQVCSYRCIASYESPQLEAFSKCVLQKNNCLCLDATIPQQPDVQPLASFRGSPLTHELAEDIFVGWLGELQTSWRVAAGQNPAYDQFPCQFQLFYRGKARGSFWYEPVFQVQTLDGKSVWRRRRYRVRCATVPGTFYFTVSDNGVISEEFWRIVDAADDLSWGLFYYSGAAKAAGQAYSGAVLVTPDGSWPPERYSERLTYALERCGIKKWELYSVDNSCCTGAPLAVPEGSTFRRLIDLMDSKFVNFVSS